MLIRQAWVAGVVGACVMMDTAGATDRFYPNCSAASPSGVYRVDAKSPENPEKGWGQPFASNFTYTLTDTRIGKTVWTRQQPMQREKGSSRAWAKEGSPMRLMVDDTGLVAAYVSGEVMVFMRGSDGRKAGEVSILESFPEKQREAHVGYSTAGPMWTSNSLWSFVRAPTADGKGEETLFVIRPNWGHRLVMDTERARLVDVGTFAGATSADQLAGAPADVARVMRAVLAAEESECMRVLEAAAGSAWDKLYDRDDYWKFSELGAQIHLTGQVRMKAAVAPLRKIEKLLIEASTGKGSGDGEGAVRDDRGWVPGLFRGVRLALRRLGETPDVGYGVPLRHLKSEGMISYTDPSAPSVKAWVAVADRIANAPKIRRDMSLFELADLVGCPDAETYEDGCDCYDYDIDGGEPYTLRVCVARGENKVRHVRKITPPVWTDPTARGSRW